MTKIDYLRAYGYTPRDFKRKESLLTFLIGAGMLAGFVGMAMLGVLD